MLSVGIWLDDNYTPEEGGGYSYYNKLIRNIDEYSFDSRLDIRFITSRPGAAFKKPMLIINRSGTVVSFLYKLTKYITSPRLKDLFQRTLYKGRINSLKKAGIDLIYYTIQARQEIPAFPFVATNWDIGHLSSYPFPEFSEKGEFEERERWYKQQLTKALLIFAESEAGRQELIRYLNLSDTRVKVIPLFAGAHPPTDEQRQQAILNKWNLTKQKYFFYPAQFWAHKNHYALVHAFKNISDEAPEIKLVFTGSDKGNQNYIRTLVTHAGLTAKVIFAGFVDNEDIYALYKNASALVLPSYLGPTNMPLLEALALECPVLCSDFPGHREMMADGALYFDPGNVQQLSSCLKKMLDDSERQQLLSKASLVRASSPFTVEYAIQRINEYLPDLIPIRKTWE